MQEKPSNLLGINHLNQYKGQKFLRFNIRFRSSCEGFHVEYQEIDTGIVFELTPKTTSKTKTLEEYIKILNNISISNLYTITSFVDVETFDRSATFEYNELIDWNKDA